MVHRSARRFTVPAVIARKIRIPWLDSGFFGRLSFLRGRHRYPLTPSIFFWARLRTWKGLSSPRPLSFFYLRDILDLDEGPAVPSFFLCTDLDSPLPSFSEEEFGVGLEIYGDF